MALILLGCSQPAPSESEQTIKPATETLHPLAAMIGCWESEDGLSREVWSKDPSGWMFGYALDRDGDNRVKFFEQMRIEIIEGQSQLIVSARSNDPVTFIAGEQISGGIGFENADHDFPQRIVYRPSPGRLDAYISLIDGSQKVEFKKQSCD